MATPISGAQSPTDSPRDLSFELEDDGYPSPRRSRGRPKRNLPSDDSDNESGTPNSGRRHRGRAKGNQPVKPERISAAVVPADAIADPVTIENDETVLAHVDEDGERKIDENGNLFGGRQFRVRTFTILGRGKRLYMLSTEPARCMGYRDSYLFFLRHKTLHRIILDEQEKEDLAERDLIPSGYRTRQIAVCTARSVFREFGAKSIIGGKRITDDYWTKEYRKLGYEEGTIADPDDKLPPLGIEYNRNQFVAWHGASNVYHQQPQVERRTTRRVPAIDDVNWITAHAQAASSYNAELSSFRRRMYEGVHEAHTGLFVYPAFSQPSRCSWTEIKDESKHDRMIIDTAMVIRAGQANPALSEVDESIYEHLSSEMIAAIEQQKLHEREEREMTSKDKLVAL